MNKHKTAGERKLTTQRAPGALAIIVAVRTTSSQKSLRLDALWEEPVAGSAFGAGRLGKIAGSVGYGRLQVESRRKV